jgi:Protein of unknown function (DUF3293)
MTNELLEAYRTSTYWVLENTPLALHVDSPSGATAQWLGEGCAGKAAFLTPCNPRSKALTTAVNAALMEQAQATVRGLGLNSAKGVSMGTDGRWCEPGMLVWPISLDTAMDLAHAWHQNAFIWLDEVWTPRLIMADTETTCEASLP